MGSTNGRRTELSIRPAARLWVLVQEPRTSQLGFILLNPRFRLFEVQELRYRNELVPFLF